MSGPLSHSVSQIIATLLIDLGIGSDVPGNDWRVFVESEPDSPDRVITVYDTVGDIDSTVMLTGLQLERCGIQVRVRSDLFQPGFSIVDSIKVAFDQTVRRTTVSIDGTDYLIHSLDRSSGPFHIGTEEDSQRDLFTVNYLVTLEQL